MFFLERTEKIYIFFSSRFQNVPRAGSKVVAGHIRPAGLRLPIYDLEFRPAAAAQYHAVCGPLMGRGPWVGNRCFRSLRTCTIRKSVLKLLGLSRSIQGFYKTVGMCLVVAHCYDDNNNINTDSTHSAIHRFVVHFLRVKLIQLLKLLWIFSRMNNQIQIKKEGVIGVSSTP